MLSACADDKISTLCLSTDQVWERGVGGRLGAIREEEWFVTLHHHPCCHCAHAAHHRYLCLLLQVSRFKVSIPYTVIKKSNPTTSSCVSRVENQLKHVFNSFTPQLNVTLYNIITIGAVQAFWSVIKWGHPGLKKQNNVPKTTALQMTTSGWL